MSDRTPFMNARTTFHGTRTPATAKGYADATLAAYAGERNTREAVAGELDAAGYAAEAKRVRA